MLSRGSFYDIARRFPHAGQKLTQVMAHSLEEGNAPGRAENVGVPRYFFHTRTQDRLIWDAVGLELPEISRSEDLEMNLTLWSEVFERQLRRGRSFMITDEVGTVLFATGG